MPKPTPPRHLSTLPNRASFDVRMPRDWGLGKVGRIQPNVVVAAVMVHYATALAEMAFEVATTH